MENLSTGDRKDAGWKVVSYKKKSTVMKISPGCTIFVSKIPDHASARDLWEFFKQGGDIKNIILPRKRDKMNSRIGFVKTSTELEAGRIISNLKQFKGLGRILKMSLNDDNKQKTYDKEMEKYTDGHVAKPWENMKNKMKVDTTSKDEELSKICFRMWRLN